MPGVHPKNTWKSLAAAQSMPKNKEYTVSGNLCKLMGTKILEVWSKIYK